MLARGSIVILAVTIALSGCVNRNTAVVTTPDTVSNTGGVGTGTVAGLHLEVLGLVEKGAGTTHSVHADNSTGGSSVKERWDLRVGEVEFVLERQDDGPVLLKMDGREYGTLDAGDHLLIDESRRVFVNDQLRE